MTGPLLVLVPEQELVDRLAELAGAEVRLWNLGDPAPERDIDLLVPAYLTEWTDLSRLAGLRIGLMQGQSLGYDGVAANLPAGIPYANAVEVHEASTGELALALILAAQRALPDWVTAQQEQRWATHVTPGLAGARVLLVGAGGVGEQVRRRLEPFEVDVVRMARTARDDAHGPILPMSELDAELGRADIVVLGVPLTDETTGLVGDAFLAAMKPGALLVNVARGKVVDTGALVRALEARRIRAALDVTDPEPLPAGHPLWSAPGVLITPHVGGHTDARIPRMERVIRRQVAHLLAGEPPENVVVGG